jgi:hypothetical protein
MMKYITLRLPEGVCLKLLFTRMNENDTWVCQMDDDMMRDVQKVIGQGFYGAI